MSLVSTYRLCKGCQAFFTHSFGPLVSQNRCWVGRGGMYKSTPPKCLICLRMWNKTVEAGWGDLRSIAEYPLEVNYWLKYDDNRLPNGFGLEWILYIDIVMKLRKLETLNFSIWLLECNAQFRLPSNLVFISAPSFVSLRSMRLTCACSSN
jgi:hypothetical protein